MAKVYKPPYKYVEAIWDDAASNSETWVSVDDIQKPERVVTRGWLVKECPTFLSIASSVSATEDYEDTVGNTLTIPRGMVVSLKELKVSYARIKSRHQLYPEPNAEEVHREQGES